MRLKRGGRELLAKALRAIKRRPETFDMANWMKHDESVKGRAPYCGTVACLAGHIVLAAGAPPINCEDYEVDALPKSLRRRGARLAWNKDWAPAEPPLVSIADLALDLVCADEEARDSLDLIFGAMELKTPTEVAARVKEWLSA